jgi:transposase-like protein
MATIVVPKIYHSNDLVEIIDHLKSTGILESSRNCPKCLNRGKTIPMKWATRKTTDQYVWRCSTCTTYSSFRDGSFLSNYRVNLTSTLRMIHSWCLEMPIVDVCNNVGISKPTMITFYRNLQHFAICDYNRDEFKIGGPGKIIEIDESLFARVKHNRGAALKRKQIWVFGMMERDTRKCVLYVVPNRKAETLIPIINKHVVEGSIVFSDMWRAYRQIQETHEHRMVNHDRHFVDPGTGVNTNSIEGVWRVAKMKIKRMGGIDRKYIQEYLDEFCWRYFNCLVREDSFDAIIAAIARHQNEKFVERIIDHNDLDELNDVSSDESNDDVEVLMSEYKHMALAAAQDAKHKEAGELHRQRMRELEIEERVESGRVAVELERKRQESDDKLRSEMLKQRLLNEARGLKRKAAYEQQRALKEEQRVAFTSQVEGIITGLNEDEEHVFPSSLTANQRAIIHGMAESAHIHHETRGIEQRELVIKRRRLDYNNNPDIPVSSQAASQQEEPPNDSCEEVLTSMFIGQVNYTAILNLDLNIEKNMLVKDPNALSDAFLNDTIYGDTTLDDIRAYFDPSAYDELVKLVQKKRRISRCKTCKTYCYNYCICCDTCTYWYHYKCQNVTYYHKSGKSKKWVSSNCKK